MKVGDLIRYCNLSVAGQNLRLVQKIRGLKTLEISGLPNSDGACFVAQRILYKSTTMTIEDCNWLREKRLKVTLRNLSYEEMLKVCKEARQKNVGPDSWATIRETCLGKTLITEEPTSVQTQNGWMKVVGTYCPYVVPTCCLTLTVKQPTVEDYSVELTDYELLHGPQEHEEIEDIEPEALEIQPPIGWDNCSEGYCRGDWLITKRQVLWIISHPEIIISNTFSNPQLAADFIDSVKDLLDG